MYVSSKMENATNTMEIQNSEAARPNKRKAGKMPPHFLRGHQIRYLVSDIEAYEKLNA